MAFRIIRLPCAQEKRSGEAQVPFGAYRREALPFRQVRPNMHGIILITGRLWKDYRVIIIW
jgi:hypothetical protein